jgi:hypothetical protein
MIRFTTTTSDSSARPELVGAEAEAEAEAEEGFEEVAFF